MIKYNEIIELAKMFNNAYYWLEVLEKNYQLSLAEMGFIVCNLK